MEVEGGAGFDLGGFEAVGFEGRVGLLGGAGFALGGFEAIGFGRVAGLEGWVELEGVFEGAWT